MKEVLTIIALVLGIAANAQVPYSEMGSDTEEGLVWEFYKHNGLSVYLSHSILHKCGNWHKVNIYIENSTDRTIYYDANTQMSGYDAGQKFTVSQCEILTRQQFKNRLSIRNASLGVGLGVWATVAILGAPNEPEFVAAPLSCGIGLHTRKMNMLSDYYEPTYIHSGENTKGYILAERSYGPYFFVVVKIDGQEMTFGWKQVKRHYWVLASPEELDRFSNGK